MFLLASKSEYQHGIICNIQHLQWLLFVKIVILKFLCDNGVLFALMRAHVGIEGINLGSTIAWLFEAVCTILCVPFRSPKHM